MSTSCAPLWRATTRRWGICHMRSRRIAAFAAWITRRCCGPAACRRSVSPIKGGPARRGGATSTNAGSAGCNDGGVAAGICRRAAPRSVRWRSSNRVAICSTVNIFTRGRRHFNRERNPVEMDAHLSDRTGRQRPSRSFGEQPHRFVEDQLLRRREALEIPHGERGNAEGQLALDAYRLPACCENLQLGTTPKEDCS